MSSTDGLTSVQPVKGKEEVESSQFGYVSFHVAPTAITSAPHAGEFIALLKPLLPDAATTTTPLATALFAATAQLWVHGPLYVPVPMLRLITSAWAPEGDWSAQ